VKAIYNTRKSWFCKGLAVKLWEPVALKLHRLWKSKDGRDVRESVRVWERERKWKKEHIKEEEKKGMRGKGGFENSCETAFVMIRAPKSLMDG
jgi:hypothetical protein